MLGAPLQPTRKPVAMDERNQIGTAPDQTNASRSGSGWCLDQDGTLTIDGTLEPWGNGGFDSSFLHQYRSNAPWAPLANEITHVVVTSGSQTSNLDGMFAGCVNLRTIDGLRFLDTAQAMSARAMFDGCASLVALDASGLYTLDVTDMSCMFFGCRNLSELDLTELDTSHVKTTGGMFTDCKSLTRLDLSSFDTSHVEDISEMFCRCVNLAEVSLTGWNTRALRNARNLFCACTSLRQIDISDLSLTRARDLSGMFRDCRNLERIVFMSNTARCHPQDISLMFVGCGALTALDLRFLSADPQMIADDAFAGMNRLVSLAITPELRLPPRAWRDLDLSRITLKVFSGANDKSVQLDGGWHLDSNDTLIIDGALAAWPVGTLTESDGYRSNAPWQLFAPLITHVEIRAGAQAETLDGTFAGMNVLTSVRGLEQLDCSNAQSARGMFFGCRSIERISFHNATTGAIENFDYMFGDCRSLRYLDLDGFDSTGAKSMLATFIGCRELDTLKLSTLDTSQVTSMSQAFYALPALRKMILGPRVQIAVDAWDDAELAKMGLRRRDADADGEIKTCAELAESQKRTGSACEYVARGR